MTKAQRAKAQQAVLTPAEFRERIRMIVGLPKPSREERPCLRTPEDRGYYPPTRIQKDEASK